MAGEIRRDVQGLRGVAVLLVVLFHCGVPGFRAGFIGVDVFFVISGFVIGSSLRREIERTGTVRIGAFYARRVRRILPALAVMTGGVLVLGVPLLRLGEVQRVASHTAKAAILSVANLYIYQSGGNYFSLDEELNPFLHCWSLGVEEQFYLVVPAMVVGLAWLARSIKRSPNGVVVAALSSLVLVSLAVSWRSHERPACRCPD